MAMITTSKNFINSCRKLSSETVLSIIASIILVFVASFFTPFILRWILLPNIVSHSQDVDFTFRTCADQLYGVCSFPEAIVDLDEMETVLSPGYYYSFSLNIELVDSPENRKLGMFQAQVSPKGISGTPLANYKKTILFRPSFYSKVYTFIRNIAFFPLYIIGFFPSFDTSKSILFTDHFFELSDNPTKTISLELQNRFIQVASADFHIRAHVGISSYLLYNYPTITYSIIFSICFTIYSGLCLLYWSNRGIELYVDEEIDSNEQPEIELTDNQGRPLNPLPYLKVLSSSLFPASAVMKHSKKKRD
uniref:Seipin n=1 Tax=Panagrolaimus sp. ES5 TaxID=591445 RepID=A0AC34F7P8_9BILA